MHHRHIIVLLMLICGMLAPDVFTQESRVTYMLEKGSKLWFTGTTTIGDYACAAVRVDGTGTVRADACSRVVSSGGDTLTAGVSVTVGVRNLDCGNSTMNDDMYAAMKADSSPTIVYRLLRSEIHADSADADSVRTLDTVGELTIAGVTQIVRIRATIHRLTLTRYHILGSKALSMHDFVVTPPSAVWGLIKADDRLVVHFDFVAVETTGRLRITEK